MKYVAVSFREYKKHDSITTFSPTFIIKIMESIKLLKVLTWLEEYCQICIKAREKEVEALKELSRRVVGLTVISIMSYMVAVSNFYG